MNEFVIFAGMIAPMETVISAAMYHDIAAMKLKGQKKWVRDHYVFYSLFNQICKQCVYRSQTTEVH